MSWFEIIKDGGVVMSTGGGAGKATGTDSLFGNDKIRSKKKKKKCETCG